MTFQDDHKLETYKSMISISVEGFKTLLLINGGAVVAMLAYLGQSARGSEVAPHVRCPLTFFVLGIFAATLSFFGSYITQFQLYNECLTGAAGKVRHMWVVYPTAAVALLSAIFFIIGAFSSVSVLSNHAVIPDKVAQPLAQTLVQPPSNSCVVNCR